MKTELTLEQSVKLIKRGIDSDLASSYEEVGFKDVPIFTLTDMLVLLPKVVEGYGELFTCSYSHHYVAGYGDFDSQYGLYGSCAKGVVNVETDKIAHELIDALYELLLWVIDNKYLKV